MATYAKNNAIGVDYEINQLISSLDKELNTKKNWGVDIYHKIYREFDDSGVYVPYTFVSGKEYKEIFLNDKVIGEVGFYISQNRSVSDFVSADCDIIFSLNLDSLDGGSLQREDEKAIMIAISAVEKKYDVSQVKTGLTNVFSDFDTERIKFRDMQPFLNFSLTVNLTYKKNNCYVMY